LRAMLQLADEGDWPVPIVSTTATTGDGVGDLVDKLGAHRDYLEHSGTWRQRRAESARRQVRAIVEDRVLRRLERLTSGDEWEARFASIAQRESDPYSVAEEVLNRVATSGQ
jgi:LAO/AO transport system kinase